MTEPRVAMVTYSSKPRGGVVHAVELSEALHRHGRSVRLFALGDPGQGFYRPVDAPHTLFPAPEPGGTLEERVFRSIDALADGLAAHLDGFDVVHVQDCIAAGAALRLRQRGLRATILRTVHHVDDFATPALIECQRRSIVEADAVLVVSEHWRNALARDFGVSAEVVTNGVDAGRFARPPDANGRDLRRRIGAEDRFLFLTVGGIEPRKGSLELVEALAAVRNAITPPPVVAVVGGHSFQDHGPYRERALVRSRELGTDRDLVVLGTVPDRELRRWYWSADAFVFPSVKEGFGLAVLEALAAGLPVIATEIPVFRQYLTDGETAILTAPADVRSLTEAMLRVARDGDLRARLGRAGPTLAARYSWDRTARQHTRIYDEALFTRSTARW
ncbi:MAG: MSMEG_0565 family glycosyltransferase [Actinomycetota bacterium]